MFDKVNEMFDTNKVTEAVETMVDKTEENVKKINGYIQNDSVRIVAEAYAEAGFTLTRAVIDTNKNVVETFKKAFAA
jgi:hypothetical protein